MNPLPLRFLQSFQDFLGTTIGGDATRETARQAIVAMTFRKRDEDDAITAETDTAKGARLVVSAEDAGRVKPYVPIRILRVMVAVRSNAKLVTAAAHNALCGSLEYLTDKTNLVQSLTSNSRQIAVMLCTRQPGVAHTVNGDIRQDSYALDVRAVGTEHTSG